MTKTQVYLPEEDLAALHATAKRTGKSVAALIREALQAARGNVSEVIARLATPRKTLYGKFKRLNIDPADYR